MTEKNARSTAAKQQAEEAAEHLVRIRHTLEAISTPDISALYPLARLKYWGRSVEPGARADLELL